MWQGVSPVATATVAGWWRHEAMTLGAAIAYYGAFSLAPILLLVISTAGLVFGEEAARGAVVRELSDLIGRREAQMLEAMVASARNVGSGAVGTIVGIVLLLVLATGVLAQIQNALHAIWEAQPPKSPFWATLRSRLLSLALIGSIGFLLLVSLVVDAGIAAAGTYAFRLFPGAELALIAANFLLSLFFASLLFGMVYWLLPEVRLPLRDLVPGAVLAGVLFTFGKSLIGLAAGRGEIASSFGAAASILTILAWIYYASQILLLGAAFAKALRDRRVALGGTAPPPQPRSAT